VEESVNVHYVKCHVRVLEELAYHFLGPKFCEERVADKFRWLLEEQGYSSKALQTL
jgi:hypothetical protein